MRRGCSASPTKLPLHGILPEGDLGSSHSLAEARVIFELGTRRSATATELGRGMDVDLGYLSRLVQALKEEGFRLEKAYRHREFGYDLTGEYWTLKLSR